MAEDLIRVADIAGLAAAGAMVSAWRFSGEQVPAAVIAALILGCLVAIIVLPQWQVYRLERLRSPGAEVLRVIAGWAVTVAVLLAVLFAMKVSQDVSRLWVGSWFLAGAAALMAVRVAAQLALTRGELARVLVRRVALVGLGDRLPAALERLAEADPTMRITAVLDLDGNLDGRWPAQVTALASFAELEARVRAGTIDHVLLAVPARAEEVLESSLERLRHLPIDVSMMLGPPSARVPLLGVTQVGDVPLIRLLERPIDGWRYVVKSFEDLVLASVLLVLAAPLMLLLAFAVKLDSPGPVFYRQHRRGFAGDAIAMLKFRTMHADRCDAPDAALVRQAVRDDLRVTRLGRFLRRTSLDELPQLLNVLRGDMSIVGPRPHAVAHDDHYAGLIDEYLGRHKVKPGITGWAQVNGFRGETRTVEEMRQRIELDLEYISKWSLALDLRILAYTLLVGFRHHKAY